MVRNDAGINVLGSRRHKRSTKGLAVAIAESLSLFLAEPVDIEKVCSNIEAVLRKWTEKYE